MFQPTRAKRPRRTFDQVNPPGLAGAKPYYVDNRVEDPSDEEEVDEGDEFVAKDLNMIEHNCDPHRLYNNPKDLACFFEEVFAPFVWWSMIANLTSWIGSAGQGILDSLWFRANGVRCLFIESLTLAFSRLPFPRIYNYITQFLSWSGITSSELEQIDLPTHHWLETPLDEYRPKEPARYSPLNIYWGTTPQLNTQGFVLIRRSSSDGIHRGSWNWFANYFLNLPKKCWEVVFDKIPHLSNHWHSKNQPDPYFVRGATRIDLDDSSNVTISYDDLHLHTEDVNAFPSLQDKQLIYPNMVSQLYPHLIPTEMLAVDYQQFPSSDTIFIPTHTLNRVHSIPPSTPGTFHRIQFHSAPLFAPHLTQITTLIDDHTVRLSEGIDELHTRLEAVDTSIIDQLGNHAILEAKHSALEEQVTLYKEYSNQHAAIQVRTAFRVTRLEERLKEQRDLDLHQCKLRHDELNTELTTLKQSNLMLVQRLAMLEARLPTLPVDTVASPSLPP